MDHLKFTFKSPAPPPHSILISPERLAVPEHSNHPVVTAITDISIPFPIDCDSIYSG
jgi:hypothetical protein